MADREDERQDVEAAARQLLDALGLEPADDRRLAQLGGHGLARFPHRGDDTLARDAGPVPGDIGIEDGGGGQDIGQHLVAQCGVKVRARTKRSEAEESEDPLVRHLVPLSPPRPRILAAGLDHGN